ATTLSPANRATSGPGAGDAIAHGALLRESLRFSFNNSIITGNFPLGCINVNDGRTPTPPLTAASETFNRVNEAGGSPTTG
ncbi:hypothetical protein NQU36_28365, partial [Escherichia coli]|uniref:hypothetical protein n=1 Tax=Escherichia coli TaxID=562 RepID=UPI002117C6CA